VVIGFVPAQPAPRAPCAMPHLATNAAAALRSPRPDSNSVALPTGTVFVGDSNTAEGAPICSLGGI
jgi:hypothetical protein